MRFGDEINFMNTTKKQSMYCSLAPKILSCATLRAIPRGLVCSDSQSQRGMSFVLSPVGPSHIIKIRLQHNNNDEENENGSGNGYNTNNN